MTNPTFTFQKNDIFDDGNSIITEASTHRLPLSAPEIDVVSPYTGKSITFYRIAICREEHEYDGDITHVIYKGTAARGTILLMVVND